jgi:hypothetical protein
MLIIHPNFPAAKNANSPLLQMIQSLSITSPLWRQARTRLNIS